MMREAFGLPVLSAMRALCALVAGLAIGCGGIDASGVDGGVTTPVVFVDATVGGEEPPEGTPDAGEADSPSTIDAPGMAPKDGTPEGDDATAPGSDATAEGGDAMATGDAATSTPLCPVTMAYVGEAWPEVESGTWPSCPDGGPCPAGDCCLQYTGWPPPVPTDTTVCVPVLDGGI
jgi:hypothetical protein